MKKILLILALTKTYLFVFQVVFQNPRVVLEDGSGRVNGGLDIALNINVGGDKERLGGSVDISGGVLFNRSYN